VAANIPVLIVEHDIDRLLSFSQSVTVMNQDEVPMAGTPDAARGDRRVQQIYTGTGIPELKHSRGMRPARMPRWCGPLALLLSLARRVRAQERGQRGPKVYSLHAPEVECIGKGKAHKPYEFGVKVSVATPLKHSKGGQFVAHVQALPGNPYDGPYDG
jgi:IS5 family transposase